jgi:hypothetical protein
VRRTSEASEADVMTNVQALELRRQLDENERRIARLGEPTSREQLLLLFSLERDVKEQRRRLSLIQNEGIA